MSSEGFTEPEEAEEPGFELADEGAVLLEVDDGPSCEDCSHFGVCAAYKGVDQLLDGWEQEMGSEPPIEPQNIAMVCEKFEVDDDEA